MYLCPAQHLHSKGPGAMYTLAQTVTPTPAVTDPAEGCSLVVGFPAWAGFWAGKHTSHQPGNRAARGLPVWDYGV